MHAFNNIAFKAARAAGKIVVRAFERLDSKQITEKGANDFVTEIDIRSEQEIIAAINKAYPDHAILCEESGLHEGAKTGRSGYSAGDEYVWIIDPLDGTANYIHGYPHFCISIAVKRRDKIECGLIYDPLRQELFTAEHGAGAFLNHHRIRVNDRKQLEGSFLGVGFNPVNRRQLDDYLESVRYVEAFSPRIRRSGSSALDFAYVAAGRLDGIWEFGIKPWDMAAGILLVREAGGMVTDFEGKVGYFESGNVVAGNLAICKELLQIVQSGLAKKVHV